MSLNKKNTWCKGCRKSKKIYYSKRDFRPEAIPRRGTLHYRKDSFSEGETSRHKGVRGRLDLGAKLGAGVLSY